ncbi:glycoside hydrolase family 3 N-terminal domain-containing protein [Bifidobacterium sp. ESL0764]|uniref:glycoside hydrolase family 3 N-terminal domain-containing protein n=1 Tax=Bifidobacterium sp. ESL0764 TaxID=2983228 RepID=UPI0023F8B84E|nr:glycoside hydrolase family 3 N-terminal domain-containing protein [Bifidobacterium sp. ESL0764]WEV65859.1 glycoside hydrolase family 3 C-terminal domain-containing protein [Bifidobacterium sp. ESL0764]
MEAKRKIPVARIIKTVLSIILAVVLIVAMALANPQLSMNKKMLSNILGMNHQSADNSKIDAQGVNANYYSTSYTKDSIKKAEDKLYNDIADEGTVLLKNDDHALPMKQGTKFSFFSANSKDGTTRAVLPIGEGAQSVTLQSSFQKAGFKVNQKLWDFYQSKTGKKYGLAKGSVNFGDAEDFRINEAPLSVLRSQQGLLNSVKGTVPVYVLSRVAGEGRDMPRSMYNHATSQADKGKTYLQPDSTELELLKYLNDNFGTVLLYVKSNAALQLDWLKQFPHIKAVLYSQNVTNSLAQIVAGKVNPSGRTTDTFAADPLASPAAQNFGSYQYYDQNGKPTKYNYIDYAEGIYVGYKYYETRYEDKVLGQGDAGDYNYAKQVVYPFGYGLSYTTFNWSGFSVNAAGQKFNATVTVKNTGSKAGKDAVELYAQAPYTQYDKDNGVEKASANLVGFAKTKVLQPGESQTVTVKFNEDQLKSYDYRKAKTYIMDPGEYRFTAARNANEATNNFLADKGKNKSAGMTKDGDTSMVAHWTPANTDVDSTTFALDSKTKKKISNVFDFASDKGVKYLTRADWTKTFPKHYGEPSDSIDTWGDEINCTDKKGAKASCTWKKTASSQLLKQLEGNDSGTPVKRASVKATPTFGKKNGLKVSDLRGAAYNDPKWDKLLDELTQKDYQQTIGFSGYGIGYLKSVQKPYQVDADSATGLVYGGTNRMFPSPMTLAQTYNTDLATRYGKMIGDEALLGGANGWYAPSMDIHRTPFSGRNGEYYSEDGFMSGSMAKQEITGAATRGVYSYIKHFLLNDQEDHRGDRPGNFSVATWSNEQAIRELYLKPFEMCIKSGTVPMKYVKKGADGKYRNAVAQMPAAQAMMTSFNRIGATWVGGSYPLIHNLLRSEWGFNGLVMTDNANTGKFISAYQMIEAGSDLKLLSAKDPTGEKLNFNDPATYQYGRDAMHRTLYTAANSNCMNGALPGAGFKYSTTVTTIQVIFNAVCVILIALLLFFSVWRWIPATVRRVDARKAKRRAKRAEKRAARKK